MTLAFFHQQIDNVDLQRGRLGQRNAVKRNGARCGFPNAERATRAYRDDVRDRRIAIEHGNGLSIPYSPKVLAEPGL